MNRDQVLSPEAQAFVTALHRKFNGRRLELLEARAKRQQQLDSGVLPDFLLETRKIRESEWRVAPIPADLQDRRVEITGPVDRKMVINALNSGAKVFMADFEDSHAPTWQGTLDGQVNMFDAVRRTISYRSPEGKQYQLVDKPAVLIVRPRGFHLEEKHFLVDGAPISGSFFDFGLYLFHNAAELLRRGTGPYYYLPKLESHLEARLWADVIGFAEKELGLAAGTVKATVLIETILAAFEMDEILWELRNNIVGLNCGRWDYIFSFIKKFRNRPEFILPDRAQVTMATHFLESYCRLLIRTCHRRGAFAMGGMAAQIPNKNDPEANQLAMDRVRQDKEREARLGHDGTWVAHPGLVPVAMEIFDSHLKGPNQLGVVRDDREIAAADLLKIPTGTITSKGLRMNIEVALRYLEAWLSGTGCVPIHGLMEDAATAEISRVQVWQWIRNPKGVTEDGEKVTLPRVLSILEEEVAKAASGRSGAHRFHEAGQLLSQAFTEDRLGDFITLAAYSRLP